MCALAVRCLADRLDDARARGRRVDPDKARLLALGLRPGGRAARGGAPPRAAVACPPRPTAFAATVRGGAFRLHDSDPELLGRGGRAGGRRPASPIPRRTAAGAKPRRCSSGRAGRSRADECLQRGLAGQRRAGRADRSQEQIERLAQRARIPLRDLDAGPADDGADRRPPTSG